MAAYNKGALAALADKAQCPYGHTKRELRAWFLAGLADAQNRTLDPSMLYAKTAERMGVANAEQ
jgi:hypothetical protein